MRAGTNVILGDALELVAEEEAVLMLAGLADLDKALLRNQALVARVPLTGVEHQHTGSAFHEGLGRRRTGRSRSDDDEVVHAADFLPDEPQEQQADRGPRSGAQSDEEQDQRIELGAVA